MMNREIASRKIPYRTKKKRAIGPRISGIYGIKEQRYKK